LSDHTEGGGGVSTAARPLFANARAAISTPAKSKMVEILRQGVPELSSFAAAFTRVLLP